jgi:YesN/AraC family two-component response regulator
VILWLNPWYLNRISSRKTNLNQCFVSAEKKGYLLREDPAMRKKIINMLLELRYEMHEKEFGHDIMCDSLIEHLLILLERHINLNTMAGNANIQQVIRYINLHYTENLTLDFLCNRFYISKFYLSVNRIPGMRQIHPIPILWHSNRRLYRVLAKCPFFV